MITALIPAVILLSSLTLVMCSNIGGTRQDLKLDADGGYTDLLIAIHDNVPQDSKIISAVKVSVTCGEFSFSCESQNIIYKMRIKVEPTGYRKMFWRKHGKYRFLNMALSKQQYFVWELHCGIHFFIICVRRFFGVD